MGRERCDVTLRPDQTNPWDRRSPPPSTGRRWCCPGRPPLWPPGPPDGEQPGASRHPPRGRPRPQDGPGTRSLRCGDPPLCFHGRPTRSVVCRREGSPNQGRVFFVCTWPGSGQCSFFRWRDENDAYTEVVLNQPPTHADVEGHALLTPEEQQAAWAGLRQGTPAWFRLRSVRITASNFGAAHCNNHFCKPVDLLRSTLWPVQQDSAAMRYGSARGRPWDNATTGRPQVREREGGPATVP